MEGPNEIEDLNKMKQEILDKFHAEGGTLEVREMFDTWLLLKLVEADESGKVEDRLRFELELVDMELALGRDRGEIKDALVDALNSANNEGLTDLFREIDAKITELKKLE